MGHKRIELAYSLADDANKKQAAAQGGGGKEEMIPLAEVRGQAELQAINEEKQRAWDELRRMQEAARRIEESMAKTAEMITASNEKLREELAARSDDYVSNLLEGGDKACKCFEADCKRICDETVSALKAEMDGIASIMSRDNTCVPMPQCVFWGIIVILAIAFGALSAVAVTNSLVLHSQTLWLILAIASSLVCSTVWSIIHFYQKEHGK